MIKALVPVAADLASSIALRCACQLASQVNLEIQTIHIKEATTEGSSSVGTGWVRLTWERTMLSQAEDDLAQLMRAERTHCPTLGEPKIVLGDRDDEILRELQHGSYDLFLEGTISTFSSAYLTKRLQSSLYQRMPCPFIMVKNLMPLERVAILLSNNVDIPRLVQVFSRTMAAARLALDVLYLKFDGAEGGGDAEAARGDLQSAKELLEKQELAPEKVEVKSGEPEALAGQLENYGLLATLLPRGFKTKTPFYKFLVATPVPIFLSWQ
ncbi:MAG: universal stress protein [Deltaproteobacteria bacterium]|nr:universal stress protein [Deltaproteobacteria bacterium]MBW2071345.1 universal stress protein [Deltaproteobacteria bacterium]